MKQLSKDNYEKRIVTIPNILSVLRIAIIPLIVWSYVGIKLPALTAVLVILSGITDVVDGFIARRFNMISDVGKALDPIADKLTQIALLFCLVTKFPFILLPLVLIIIKETSSFVLRAVVIHKTGKVDGAVWHGKLNTVVLYSVMFLHTVWYTIPTHISLICIFTSCAIMLFSYALYSIDGIKQLIKHHKEK